jgi:hypothetical protein
MEIRYPPAIALGFLEFSAEPIVNPIDILVVRGIPKFDTASIATLFSLMVLVVAFVIVANAPSSLSHLIEAIC